MSVWESKTLGDLERESDGTIQTGPFGSQLHMSDYSDTGTPVVMPTNIRDPRIDTTGIARVGDEHVERLARHKLRAGDIIYSRRGDVEKCALITENEEGWLCGTGCLLVRVQGPNLDARFLSYLLSRPETRAWISQHAVGATMPNLNTEILREVPVDVPDVKTQHAIAATLGALDGKIESNRRAVAIALSLAMASYEHAALSASRERLGDLATLVLGGTPSRKRPELWENGSIPWIASGAANAEIVLQPTELITQDALAQSAAKMMPKGATVIAITGATLGQVALLGIDTSGNQSLVGVWADKPALTTWLHLALRASVNDLVKSATGAAQQHVNKGNVAELMVPVLDDEELDEWAAVNVPLIEQCVQLEAESQRLTALRDALLPELLSGRIRVSAEGAAA